MTVRRDGVFIWVTWLSKLLVGDSSCEWASWFKAHFTAYDKAPSDFDTASWLMNHTALTNEVRSLLENAGSTVRTENQNLFRIQGNSGTVLGGKPDLVALSENGSGIIYDIKTGQPRPSDTAQVMIYMYGLPHTPEFRGMEFDGRLVYTGDRESEIPASAVDDTFRSNLHGLIRRISDAEPARRVPSASECRMCDLTAADCPERIEWEEAAEGAVTADF